MKTNWRELPRDATSPQYAGIYATLNPKGIIKINRATFEKMGSPEAVKILYDPANSRLGLQPTGGKMKNAYPVARQGSHGGRIIRAYRMITEFELALPATVRFYDAEIDNEGVLILDLRTARVPPSVANHHTRKATRVSTRNGSDGGIQVGNAG